MGGSRACPLVRRLGIADRADCHRCGHFASRTCVGHRLRSAWTERTDPWQHHRLQLLQRAGRRRNKRGDIAVQRRFAACFHARLASHGSSDAFNRNLWIQLQESSLRRGNHPHLRNHLARGVPRLSRHPHSARSIVDTKINYTLF